MSDAQLLFLGPLLFGLIIAGGCMAMIIIKLIYHVPIATDPLIEARMAIYRDFQKSLQAIIDEPTEGKG